VRDGKHVVVPRKTLAQAIERYVREQLPLLAASEQRSRIRQLKWWKKRLGRRFLQGGVTRAAATEELRQLRTGDGPTGREVCYATTNRYKAALSAVLSAAVEDWEWLESNPLHRGSRRKRPKGEREKERDRELSAAERKRLLAACQESADKRLYLLTLCALASGARQGELMSVEWTGLELRPTIVEPDRGKRKVGVPRATVLDTKNGEDRVIYFPGEAGKLLRMLARRRRRSRYVFAAPGDRSSSKPEFPTGAWRYAKKCAHLEDFRFHDLRHCWACEMLDSGANLAQLMILGGWRSPIMVRRYAKRAQRHGSTAVEAMHARSVA
jgi:integrase